MTVAWQHDSRAANGLRAAHDAVSAHLAPVARIRSLEGRIDQLSAALLGRPYRAFPLVGGPETPEELVTRLDGFDCVTYAETVLALAWSRTAADYERVLTRIRYLQGRVRWIDRNHYMTQWIRRNVRAGRFTRVDPRTWVWGAEEPRTLTALPRYPAQRWRPRWFPSARVARLAEVARTGDLVGFVSNRTDLDTYHVGLLVQDEVLCVRHASRKRGEVIHQPLAEYLASDEVPGMLVARPLPVRSSP